MIKRGNPNVFGGYWDIPGGSVEVGETPVDAVKKEALEEVNLVVNVQRIIQEDSVLDAEKDIVFTRLTRPQKVRPKSSGNGRS